MTGRSWSEDQRMYLVGDPTCLWLMSMDFFAPWIHQVQFQVQDSSSTPSVAVSHQANRHVNRTCQSSCQTSCQPSCQRTPFFLQVIMMPSRSSTEKATSLTPSPWATRWAPISWKESKSLHIFRYSPSPQKFCFTFILSIFFDYLSQISKPCWSRNSAHKPIWKRRWCLGTWG